MHAAQLSFEVDEDDAVDLKYPIGHFTQLGCFVEDPTTAVYQPLPHFVWATHESVFRVLADALALKVPVGHRLHTGLAVAVPAVAVYRPAPHFVCATHVIVPP